MGSKIRVCDCVQVQMESALAVNLSVDSGLNEVFSVLVSETKSTMESTYV